MYRFAAADPFTSRAGRFVLRRVLRFPLARTAFFLAVLRRLRCVVLPPMRPARRNSSCVAAVCCANPANPPGGTMSFTGFDSKIGMTLDMVMRAAPVYRQLDRPACEVAPLRSPDQQSAGPIHGSPRS